jgi:hypothetical protein
MMRIQELRNHSRLWKCKTWDTSLRDIKWNRSFFDIGKREQGAHSYTQ